MLLPREAARALPSLRVCVCVCARDYPCELVREYSMYESGAQKSCVVAWHVRRCVCVRVCEGQNTAAADVIQWGTVAASSSSSARSLTHIPSHSPPRLLSLFRLLFFINNLIS